MMTVITVDPEKYTLRELNALINTLYFVGKVAEAQDLEIFVLNYRSKNLWPDQSREMLKKLWEKKNETKNRST